MTADDDYVAAVERWAREDPEGWQAYLNEVDRLDRASAPPADEWKDSATSGRFPNFDEMSPQEALDWLAGAVDAVHRSVMARKYRPEEQQLTLTVPARMARALRVAAGAQGVRMESYIMTYLLRVLEDDGFSPWTLAEPEMLEKVEQQELLDRLPEPPASAEEVQVGFPIVVPLQVYEKLREAAGGSIFKVRGVAADIVVSNVDGHVRWMGGLPGE